MRLLTLSHRLSRRNVSSFRRREFRIPLLALTTIVTFGSSASAELFRPGDTIPQVAGDLFTWNVGDSGSTFSGWDVFNSGDPKSMDPSSPDGPDVSGQFGTPHTIRENGGNGAFFTGGNIYSFSAPTDFTATVNSGLLGGSSGSSFTRIVAQFRTLGTEADYDSILLSSDTGTPGSIAPNVLVETGRGSAAGGFGGESVDTLAVWDLGEAQESYRLDFNAAGSSMSLDQFFLDTKVQSTAFPSVTAVPEPSGWAGLAAAGIGFAGWRARRRRHRRAGTQAEEAQPETGEVAVG